MNVQEEISELLEQWVQLTQAESEAIQSGLWLEVDKIQTAKQDLQPLITAAMEKSAENSPAQAAKRFQTDFKRLVAWELHNRGLLAAKMEDVAQAKDLLGQSARNLRRIHHTYTQKPEAAWHSYS